MARTPVEDVISGDQALAVMSAYDASPALRAEFGSLAAWSAFVVGIQAGRIRGAAMPAEFTLALARIEAARNRPSTSLPSPPPSCVSAPAPAAASPSQMTPVEQVAVAPVSDASVSPKLPSPPASDSATAVAPRPATPLMASRSTSPSKYDEPKAVPWPPTDEALAKTPEAYCYRKALKGGGGFTLSVNGEYPLRISDRKGTVAEPRWPDLAVYQK